MMHEMFSGAGDIANSPFIVPVAGCFMIATIVVAGNWSSARKREIESQERLAAIARGIVPPPTREELEMTSSRPSANRSNRYQNIRLTGIILTGGALGLIVFFFLLADILHVREVLCGAAASLIPLGLGLAFLVDAWRQKRDMDDAAAMAASSSLPSELVR